MKISEKVSKFWGAKPAGPSLPLTVVADEYSSSTSTTAEDISKKLGEKDSGKNNTAMTSTTSAELFVNSSAEIDGEF